MTINFFLFDNCSKDLKYYMEMRVIMEEELTEIFKFFEKPIKNIELIRRNTHFLVGILYYILEEPHIAYTKCRGLLRISPKETNIGKYLPHIKNILSQKQFIMSLLA
jgi:hypothetical protein